MKLIKQSVEYLPQAQGIEGIYKQVELVGRTCYKSQDNITEDSAEPFVNRMIKSNHLAMCEHGTVYLQAPADNEDLEFWKVANSPYSKAVWKDDMEYVTTNLRVLAENFAMDLLDKYLCEPTEHHVKRISLKFTISRAIANEFVRHRTFSFAQESTRYCNYSKDKFHNELTYIEPSCFESLSYKQRHEYKFVWLQAESSYMKLLELGVKPQVARDLLPLALKTELVMTGFEEDWRHFLDLRYRGTTGAPHPDAKEVATMAHDLILDKLGMDL